MKKLNDILLNNILSILNFIQNQRKKVKGNIKKGQMLKIYIKKDKFSKKKIKSLKDQLTSLQNKHDDLNKTCNRFSKENDSLSNVTSYSSSIDDLKIENKALRNQVKDITLTLAMFIQGKENLNILLENQKKILNRTGL
jgi:seryl-tRNA synthetase